MAPAPAEEWRARVRRKSSHATIALAAVPMDGDDEGVGCRQRPDVVEGVAADAPPTTGSPDLYWPSRRKSQRRRTEKG